MIGRITWICNSLVRTEALGMLPHFLSPLDPRPARVQLHEAYAHGGGWQPFAGFTLQRPTGEPTSWSLQYPEDPPMQAIGYARLRAETIVLFENSWVAIVQPSGEFEIARMD